MLCSTDRVETYPKGRDPGLLQRAGQLAISYKIYRCWVSEYQALPDLDANAEPTGPS